MIQLYKRRSFGELFSDTFAFVKQNGKHFYKNYLLINGAFILVLMVLAYFFMKVYSALMTSSFAPGADSGNTIDNYFNENGPLIVVFALLFCLVAIFTSFFTYVYTPVYMLLYARKGSNNFTTKDILNVFKQNAGKFFIYVAATLLISIAVFMIGGIVAFILIFTIIGAFLLPILIATVALSYNNSLMEYLNSKKGIFDCFGYGFQLTFKRFWTAVGCVALFYLMIYIVQSFATLIPYFAGLASILTNIESLDSNPDESMGLLFTVMIVFYVLSFLLGLLGNTIVQINQGIVYFSLKEETENINTTSAIDQIGTSEE